jgi:cold shock CspA family protein
LGISDLSGNVWEWVLSPIQLEYKYHLPEEIDVEGESRRETRGGSWKNDAARSRLAYRGSNPPESQDQTDGFRLVHTGYDLTIEEWQQRVEKVIIRKANEPLPVVNSRVTGQITVLHDRGGKIIQSDGTFIAFDISDVLIPDNYPEQYQLSSGSYVEFEIEEAKAKKITHKLQGTVDDWDPERAYGEIIADDGSRIYMHQSVIATIEDWRTMKDGDLVEFEVVQGYLYGEPSWEARNVRIIHSSNT